MNDGKHISQFPDTQLTSSSSYGLVGGVLPPPIKVSNNKHETTLAPMKYEPPRDIFPDPYGQKKPDHIDFTQENFPLASADYPRQTASHIMDPGVQPCYIPPPQPPKLQFSPEKLQAHTTDLDYQEYLKNKKNKLKLEDILEKCQIPFLITVLFFLFNLPSLSDILENQLFFIPIYKAGQFNANGLLLRSVLFGCIFFAIQSVLANVL